MAVVGLIFFKCLNQQTVAQLWTGATHTHTHTLLTVYPCNREVVSVGVVSMIWFLGQLSVSFWFINSVVPHKSQWEAKFNIVYFFLSHFRYEILHRPIKSWSII